MQKKVALIDTKAANTHSVLKALKYIGADVELTSDISEIKKSAAVFFPGVGAFGSVMDAIERYNLKDIIVSEAKSKKPFFGICVGMQVLFNVSEENNAVNGLSVFKGKVIKFKKAKIVPHIGWNDIIGYSMQDIGQSKFYFVHSYYCEPEDKSLIYATTDYDGEVFPSIIKKDNLFATQFHPEKSGEAGLELLRDFMSGI